jgi:hyperosmotically inducible protein
MEGQTLLTTLNAKGFYLMLNLKNLVLICGASAVLAGFTGCNMMRGEGGTSDRSEGRSLDDKQITSSVEKKLKAEPTYKFTDVDVKTFAGVVQLSGFVSSEEQKQRAGDLAQSTEGVTRVVNNISLKEQLAPTGSAATNQPPQQP